MCLIVFIKTYLTFRAISFDTKLSYSIWTSCIYITSRTHFNISECHYIWCTTLIIESFKSINFFFFLRFFWFFNFFFFFFWLTFHWGKSFRLWWKFLSHWGKSLSHWFLFRFNWWKFLSNWFYFRFIWWKLLYYRLWYRLRLYFYYDCLLNFYIDQG
jgi:hypothetical protein